MFLCSKCCKLVKFCHTNRMGPFFLPHDAMHSADHAVVSKRSIYIAHRRERSNARVAVTRSG